MSTIAPETAAMSSFDWKTIEAELLRDSAFEQCVIKTSKTPEGNEQLVIYYVPSGTVWLQHLTAKLQSIVKPYAEFPYAFVPISALPLTNDGQLDHDALGRFLVIDPDTVKQWEATIRAIPGITRAIVATSERSDPIPRLYLKDLLKSERSDGAAKACLATQRFADPGQEMHAIVSSRSAISYGDPLTTVMDNPTTLQEALVRASTKSPERGITYIESDGANRFQSYAELLDEASRILSGLRRMKLQPGDKVILQLPRSRDFVPAFWACVLGGFIAAPLASIKSLAEPDPMLSKFRGVWRILGKPTVVTTGEIATQFRSMAEALDFEGLQITSLDNLRLKDSDKTYHSSCPNDLALLATTSGSTGDPKIVMLTHLNLACQSAAVAQMNGFNDQDVSLNWFPLDHVGGLVMFHLRDVAICCSQIQGATDAVLKDPLRWLDWIDRYRATIGWAPNFAFDLINTCATQIATRQWDLSSMRFLLNGGEAIVARQARKFLTLLEPLGLPRTAIRPAWGMSETSSGVTYSDSFALATTTDDDPWVSLGRPIPGVQLRIVNQAGELVGERVIGRLQAKGAPISPGYYGNSKANEIAFTKDGWLNTGDVGFLRDGCLTITGREKEMIIINGMNFDYHSIETAVEELDGVKVSNTAALAICDGEAASDRLAVFFTPILWDESSLNFLIEAVRDKILRDLHINADFIIPVEDSAMPKTSIGKIERPQLKQRFDRGDFRTAIEKCNLRKNDDEMLPRWFHRRIWRRREHQTLESLPQIGVLVFVDAGGLGNALCKQLQDAGCVVVAVEVGPGFAQSGDCCYCINPANRDDYKRLFRAIAMQGKRVSHIIHLWSCDKCPRSIVDVDGLELAQRNGLFSLLYLVQAISATRSPEQRLQLLFITNAVEQLSQLNSAAYEKSPALGLLKSVSYEFPWIRARHVDLEVDQTAANVHCIIRELRDASRDEEVAYRQGRRLIPMLVDLDLTSECQRTCRIKKGGIYLVTGGLGGVGFHVAQYLLKEHHARVLVVGRSELSDEKPPSHVSAFVARSKVSKLGMLQQLGEVVYQRADVASITEMASAIECGMSRWGVGLDGVFHLAGHLDRLMLSELTSDSLMAALLPKVAGSWILDQLLEQRPNTLFVSFSSVVGCFGGLSMGAYAAACRFQSAFADYQFRQRNIDSYCLNWSTWKGVGMNAGCLDDRLSRERGFMSLSAKQAVHSLDIALCQEERQVQIGLDHNKAHMRKHFGSRNVGLWQPIVYYGSDSSHVSPKSLAALKLTDRFGTAGEFVFVPKDELAELGGDAIDRGLYGDMLFEATTSESNTNQMTSIMHGISQIWCDTLELSEVGNDTNFFDVGGHSLVIPVVLEKIGETFNVHVDVIDIFRYPTISALARHVHDRLMSVTAVISDSSAHVDSAAREHIATRRYAQRKRRGIDLGINDRS